MLHTKFHGNRSTGSGDFRRVFTIYGRGSHLGHVTSIMLIIYHFHVPYLAYIQNLVKKSPMASDKSKFSFSYVNDLDLEYSYTFINSISCLHLPTFRSQTATVSEKSTEKPVTKI